MYGFGAKCNGTNFSVKESLLYYVDFLGGFLNGVKYRVRELFLGILAIGKECLNLIFLDRK
jgi:hypothetical protein